jgi:hypothetical protein
VALAVDGAVAEVFVVTARLAPSMRSNRWMPTPSS